MTLVAVDDDLWIADDRMPVAFPFRVPFASGSVRMTVARTAGGLLLHSPVRPAPALVDAVRALGPVRFVVAPCVMHTTYAPAWARLFPDAALHVAPRTGKRVPALASAPVLDDAAPLSPDVPQVLVAGHRNYETLFLHARSRTLIVTDLVYGPAPTTPLLERVYLRANGVRAPIGVTRYSRRAVTKPELFRASMQRALSWDFERVIMSHGPVVERDGRALVARAWRL